MLRKITACVAFAMASSVAHAGSDPVEELRNAFIQEQAKSGNEVAGFGGVCLNILLFSRTGASQTRRECFVGFLPKSFIDDFAAQNKLQFVYRTRYMDLVLIPNSGAPKGNFYYQAHYNDAGQVSEVFVTNDALP